MSAEAASESSRQAFDRLRLGNQRRKKERNEGARMKRNEGIKELIVVVAAQVPKVRPHKQQR